MWRWEDEGWGEDVRIRRCEDVKMRRCEDEKMFYRPPLLEEPFAQTLSGTKRNGTWLYLQRFSLLHYGLLELNCALVLWCAMLWSVKKGNKSCRSLYAKMDWCQATRTPMISMWVWICRPCPSGACSLMWNHHIKTYKNPAHASWNNQCVAARHLWACKETLVARIPLKRQGLKNVHL